jgi:DNA-binding response OmpR family regulator
MTSRSTAILVHEPEPYWTPELQRQFVDEPVTVRGCSSPVELDALRTNYDAVVIVFELASSSLTTWLTWLTRRRIVDDPVVILGSPELAELEWTFRSAGVASFRIDPISGRELARQCRQWLTLRVGVP